MIGNQIGLCKTALSNKRCLSQSALKVSSHQNSTDSGRVNRFNSVPDVKANPIFRTPPGNGIKNGHNPPSPQAGLQVGDLFLHRTTFMTEPRRIRNPRREAVKPLQKIDCVNQEDLRPFEDPVELNVKLLVSIHRHMPSVSSYQSAQVHELMG